MQRSVAAIVSVFLCTTAGAGEPVDLDAVNSIRQQGFHRSQVMDIARYVTDHIGPRLTGSPALKQANEWARDRLREWGLEADLEPFEIDHGWTFSRCAVHMLTPSAQPLFALPKSWTPGTDGAQRGRAVRATLKSPEDLEKLRGQLSGAIVLLDGPREPSQIEAKLFRRHSDEDLATAENFEIPDPRGDDWRRRYRERFEFWPVLAKFLVDEGVIATIEVSERDNGVVRVDRGGTFGTAGTPRGVPALRMASEHYNRLVRLVDDGVEVELEIDVTTTFFMDEDVAYSTIGVLPGTDLADQVVMVGAHLDSWHAGTGATDNGGNCAVVMEAVRILKSAGLQPRRTIKVGLWGGEEMGFLGSQAYVEKYLATRPESTDPEQLELPKLLRETTWPIQPLPGHAKLSAYFNLDYGAGRIRGVYAQENVAARPIFDSWLEPLHDLGAATVSPKAVGGTDHLSFDRVGIPAFQFIQDPMDYMGRTHHTNVDTFDHLHRDDLMQSSVVLATFIWHAATRDEMMPRKPLPTQPPAE